MSKSFFTSGAPFKGSPTSRPQQLQQQMVRDKQNANRLKQLGHTSLGFKPKPK